MLRILPLRLSSFLVLLLVFAAAWFPASALSAREAVHQTRPAEADGTIVVENVEGSIEIRGWERNEVELTGTVGEHVDDVEFHSSGGRTVVKVEVRGHRHGRGRDTGADLTLNVPRNSSLRLASVSASIDVSGVNGAVEVETVSGRVNIGGEPSSVDAESVSGRLHFQGSTSTANLESVSGTVEATGVRGKLSAESVSGTVRLSEVLLERGTLSTVSGSIEMEGDLSRGGRLQVDSHSGSITLTLPESIAAEFRVQTFSGSIRNDFGPPAKRTSRYGPGHELDFATGTDARIDVESFSGSVRLTQK